MARLQHKEDFKSHITEYLEVFVVGIASKNLKPGSFASHWDTGMFRNSLIVIELQEV